MKKYIFSLLAAALLFTGCDDIATDDRFIEVEGVTPKRAVLLEDFTGQKCMNCPTAHESIDRFIEQYGDAVIPVAVHCGGFGIAPSKRQVGLMQPEGNTYNDRWGINEWPKGVVNRSSGALNPEGWASALRAELDKEPRTGIDLSAMLDDEGKNIVVECTLKPLATFDGRLTVWVVEDGIVARQTMPDGSTNREYVHNHVFRAVLSDVNGDAVKLVDGVHQSRSYSAEVRVEYQGNKETWNTDNLSIVAFVEGADGVEQAARTKVEKSNE